MAGFRTLARALADQVRALRRDARGLALPLVGMMLPVIFGMGAIAVDASHLYKVRHDLQATADAAARASAWKVPDAQATLAEAQAYASLNLGAEAGPQAITSDQIEIGTWDSDSRSFTVGGASPDALRVTALRGAANGNPVDLILAPAIGVDTSDVSARAVAAFVFAQQACVLALAGSGTGITISGNATVQALQCGFAANSTDPDAAMLANGSSSNVDILSLYLAGGLDDPHGVVTTTEETYTNTDRPLEDPYAVRQQAISDAIAGATTSPTANLNSTPNSKVTLDPGRYPAGYSFKGEAELMPGTYVFSGDVKINSQADVYGDDVTILLDDSDIDANGGADTDLVAPTTGPLSGIVLARDGAPTSSSKIAGGAGLMFTGAVYMPDADLHFGGTSAPGGCLQIAANRVEFAGTPDFEVNCDPFDGEDIDIEAVALVK